MLAIARSFLACRDYIYVSLVWQTKLSRAFEAYSAVNYKSTDLLSTSIKLKTVSLRLSKACIVCSHRRHTNEVDSLSINTGWLSSVRTLFSSDDTLTEVFKCPTSCVHKAIFFYGR